MIGKYKVAHLLGRTNGNEKRFRRVEVEMTKAGYICFVPAVYDFEIYKKNAEVLNDMCYEKLLVCDLCVVVTPEHIGKSTQKRIHLAKIIGKPVCIWNEGGGVVISA